MHQATPRTRRIDGVGRWPSVTKVSADRVNGHLHGKRRPKWDTAFTLNLPAASGTKCRSSHLGRPTTTIQRSCNGSKRTQWPPEPEWLVRPFRPGRPAFPGDIALGIAALVNPFPHPMDTFRPTRPFSTRSSPGQGTTACVAKGRREGRNSALRARPGPNRSDAVTSPPRIVEWRGQPPNAAELDHREAAGDIGARALRKHVLNVRAAPFRRWTANPCHAAFVEGRFLHACRSCQKR